MNIHSSSHVHYIRARSGNHSKQFDAIEGFIYKLIGRELFEKPCWSHVEVFEFSGSCFSVLPLREDCLSQSPGNHHSERETSEECFHLCIQEGESQNWSLKNRDYFSRFCHHRKMTLSVAYPFGHPSPDFFRATHWITSAL